MLKLLNKEVNKSEFDDLFKLVRSTKNSDKRALVNIYQLYATVLYLVEYTLLLKNIYLPFTYLEKVKRKGENYTLKVILGEDLLLLFLALSWQAENSILHGVSLIFLLISFWCVYELGYYENDYIAENYEQNPQLSPAYHVYRQMMRTYCPILWSLAFGLIGIVLLNIAQGVYLPFIGLLVGNIGVTYSTALFFLSWTVFLAGVRYSFKVYNYFNKRTRTWLYIVLQSIRYYGFLWVTPTNLIGISLLASQILSRSLLYIVYRYSGGNSQNWPREIPDKVLRCSIFVFTLITICFGTQSIEALQSWQTWIIFAWCIIRGQKQIRKTFSQFQPIFQDSSN